jgi:hypothetical protein
MVHDRLERSEFWKTLCLVSIYFPLVTPSFIELSIVFLGRGGTRSTNTYYLYVLMHILLHLSS